MKIRRLCKSADSMRADNCPAVYVADDLAKMVGQGKRLDSETTAQLLNLAEDEVANVIPTETVLRATALFLAERGESDLSAQIEAFVAKWEGSRP